METICDQGRSNWEKPNYHGWGNVHERIMTCAMAMVKFRLFLGIQVYDDYKQQKQNQWLRRVPVTSYGPDHVSSMSGGDT